MFWFKKKNKKPIGIILWKGNSLFDGEKIMIIATGVFNKSKNSKTGEMIQTYILRRDICPSLAHRLGEDESICTICKHKENSTCYVNIGQGPRNVYNAYHNGSYRDFEEGDIKYFKGRDIRIGSYGDPGVIPFEVIEYICKDANKITGYSHFWKNCDQRLKKYCMASVDSIKGYMKEYYEANKLGWRTFRIREDAENPLMEHEIMCPASKESGEKTTCNNCGFCNGLKNKSIKNVSIILHGDSEEMGSMWKLDRYIKMMKKIKNKKKYRRDYKSERKMFKKVCPY